MSYYFLVFFAILYNICFASSSSVCISKCYADNAQTKNVTECLSSCMKNETVNNKDTPTNIGLNCLISLKF